MIYTLKRLHLPKVDINSIMAKSNRKLLEQLEQILKELDYTIRYEKGNFQSGYCLVENTKVVVVNKFFDLEGRVNSLLEILENLEIDRSLLSRQSIDALQDLLPAIPVNQELF